MADKYVLFSVKETDTQDHPRFWSKADGWVDLVSADRFSAQEMLTFETPAGAHWCREIIAAYVVVLW